MIRKLLELLGIVKPMYVSEADQFLQKFDREHPERAESQIAEAQKHQDIFRRKAKDRVQW